MNPQDAYCHLYELLHNYKGVHPFMITPFRRVVRHLANFIIPRFFKKKPFEISKIRSEVIVSLTSFPARINVVYLVIQCMLRQTLRPKKIILWLAKSQFMAPLPESLTSLVGDVFEIRLVDGDIRSHKKYYYALKEYPDDWILLIDDDLFYPSNMIEKMLTARDLYPGAIICRFAYPLHPIDNIIPRHFSWWHEDSRSSMHDQQLFFGSGGGTLIKKEFFDDRVTDINLALQLAPTADDIWLNAMSNIKGTDKYKIRCGQLLQIQIKENERLCWENVGEDRNDAQFDAVIDYFAKENIFPF